MNDGVESRAPPIFLIGFMTAGKTTVGRLLAARLGWDFRDLDDVIAEAAGRSVREIFAVEGEASFRAREARAVRQAVQWARTVVATGGGAACDETSLATMLATARVVALDVNADDVIRRAGSGEGRPLLESAADPAREVRERLARREPFYARAHHRVDTRGRAPEDVAAHVLRVLDLPTGQDVDK